MHKSLLATMVLAGASASSMQWRDLMVHDCKGGLHFVPNTGVETNVNIGALHHIFDEVLAVTFERAKCMCTEGEALTMAEFKRFFFLANAEMWLSNGMGDETYARDDAARVVRRKCPLWKDPLGMLQSVAARTSGSISGAASGEWINGFKDLFAGVMPASCTYDRYTQNKGCAFQLPLNKFQVKLQFTLAQCPDPRIALPYLSVQCAGNGCYDLLKPCTSDSQCGDPNSSGKKAVKCMKLTRAPSAAEIFEHVMGPSVARFFGAREQSTVTADDWCPGVGQVQPQGGLLGMVAEWLQFAREQVFFDDAPLIGALSGLSGLSSTTRLGVCFTDVGQPDYDLLSWANGAAEEQDPSGIWSAKGTGIHDQFSDAYEGSKTHAKAKVLAPYFPCGSGIPCASVFTAAHLNGERFTTPPLAGLEDYYKGGRSNPITPLAYSNCRGEARGRLFLPRLGLAYHTKAPPVLGKLATMVRTLVSCKAAIPLLGLSPTSMSWEQFRAAFEVYSLDTHLLHWTVDGRQSGILNSEGTGFATGGDTTAADPHSWNNQLAANGPGLMLYGGGDVIFDDSATGTATPTPAPSCGKMNDGICRTGHSFFPERVYNGDSCSGVDEFHRNNADPQGGDGCEDVYRYYNGPGKCCESAPTPLPTTSPSPAPTPGTPCGKMNDGICRTGHSLFPERVYDGSSCSGVDQFHRNNADPQGGDGCEDVYRHYNGPGKCCESTASPDWPRVFAVCPAWGAFATSVCATGPESCSREPTAVEAAAICSETAHSTCRTVAEEEDVLQTLQCPGTTIAANAAITDSDHHTQSEAAAGVESLVSSTTGILSSVVDLFRGGESGRRRQLTSEIDTDSTSDSYSHPLNDVKTLAADHTVALPSSCSYSGWSSSGQCKVRTTDSLTRPILGTSVGAHLHLHRCPARTGGSSSWFTEGIPTGGFGLSGTWIEAIRSMTPCSTSSDCISAFGSGSGLACIDLSTDLGLGVDVATGLVNVQDLLSRAFVGADAAAGTPAFADIDTETGYGGLSAKQTAARMCFAPDESKKAIRGFVRRLAGQTHIDGTTDATDAAPSSLKFCLPDTRNVADLIEANIGSWAEANIPAKAATPGVASDHYQLPFLAEETAQMGHSSEPGADTRTVSLSLDLKGVTKASFTNLQRAALVNAFADSVGVSPAYVFVVEVSDSGSSGSRARRLLRRLVGGAGGSRRLTSSAGASAQLTVRLEVRDLPDTAGGGSGVPVLPSGSDALPPSAADVAAAASGMSLQAFATAFNEYSSDYAGKPQDAAEMQAVMDREFAEAGFTQQEINDMLGGLQAEIEADNTDLQKEGQVLDENDVSKGPVGICDGPSCSESSMVDGKSSSLGTSAITGIAIGVIAGVALIIAVVVVKFRSQSALTSRGGRGAHIDTNTSTPERSDVVQAINKAEQNRALKYVADEGV